MKFKITWLLMPIVALMVQFSFAQEKTITGKVTGESDGSPLIGVNVVVKGTSRGVQTDFDGNYAINASPGEVLVFSYVSMITREVTVGASNTYNVSLQDDVASLDEVVVVAYGTQSKESLTGSVGTVKTEEIEAIRQADVVQGIVGKVAGVQVINNSGQPGAAPTVRIRGIGSINASSAPLYVVNGVPFNGSITSINPSDIESFTVLKDAAAAALYGSRGSNGVIIITTKKGRQKKLEVNFDVSTSYVDRANKDYDYVRSPQKFYEAHFMAIKNFLVSEGFSSTEAGNLAANSLVTDNGNIGYALGYNITDVAEDNIINPSTGLYNSSANILYQEDWNDYMFNETFSNKTFLSLRGGNENASVYFSLGHENNKAYIVNSNFERATANLSVDLKPTDNLTIGAVVNYAHTIQNTPDQGGYAGAFSWTRSIAPIYPVFGYGLDGTPILNAQGQQVYDFGDGTGGTPQIRAYAAFANPYATTLLDKKERTVDNLFGQAYLKYKFWNDFTFTYNLSADLYSTHNISFDTPVGGDAGGETNGRSTPSAQRNFTESHQQLLEWSKKIGNHSVDVLVGHEFAGWKSVYLDAQKTNFLLPQTTVLDHATNIQTVNNYEYDYDVEGYLGRINYNYLDKYYLNGSYRRDASSVFSPDNRWGNFYGAGIAWRISQENFLKNSSVISELKLKSSIGQQGNDRILYPTGGRNYYAYEDQYSVTNNNGAFGLSLAFQGNEELTWETSTNFNAGFELGLFDNRISLDFEYFTREVSDLLFNTPQPPSSGLPSFPENIGDMENTGFELTLNATIIESEKVFWSVNANATHFENEITSLPREFIDSGNFRYEEGRSIYDYYMREFSGVNQNNGAALFYADVLDDAGEPSGERVLTEEFTEASEYFLDKSAIPDVYGGFGSNLTVGNFSFGINFAYQIGGYGVDNTYFGLLSPEPGGNYHNDLFTKTWTPDNVTAELPVVVPNNDLQYYNTSSMRLIDASYLSLQDISMAYTFKPDVAERFGLSSLRIYINANNVYLWSARQGYDPRLSLTGSNGNANFSLVRNTTLGVNIKF